MSIKNILNQCIELGIKLSKQNDNLKVDAPKGAMNQELLSEIKNNKNELLKFLDEHSLYTRKNDLTQIYPKVKEFKLSSGQSQMWFLDKAQKSNDIYQFYRIVHIDGTISVSMLDRALAEIISRHSALRTCYRETETGLQQFIVDDFDFILDYVGLGSETGKRDALSAAQAQFKKASFDLSSDLMLKALLIKLNDDTYQLHIKLHHIATDGWSIGLIVKELTEYYTALSSGQIAAENNPYQYIDYAHWQQSKVSQTNIKNNLAFYKDYLADAPTIHGLPVNKGKRTELSYARNIPRQLSKETSLSLKSFCQTHRITQFSLLQFCVSIVFSRYSNSQDIVMGVPVANRSLQELSKVVGYFVNTLPIRTKINSEQSILSALQLQSTGLLDVMEKQNVPFDEIVKHTMTDRVEGVSPLVQILFSFQNNDIPDLCLGNSTIKVETPQADFIDLDLDIECIEVNDQLIVNWNYADNLFSASLIESMALNFERLLDSVLVNPDLKIKDLKMLSDEEIKHLVHGLNDTAMDYPKDKCIHELFEQQAADNPDNVAVMFEDKQLTYKQLNEKANQLAHYLKAQHDIQPDTLVGLCVERSLEMVIGILGILKAGGTYVPLDPGYPQGRLNYMLEDAYLDVVLSQRHVQDSLSAFKGAILSLNGIGETESHFCAEYANNNLTVTGLTSMNLAYVIYTSGSTGKPKGVMVAHQALFNRIHWMNNKYGMSTDDKVLQKTPYSFDVSVWEFIWTLAYGAQLVVARPEGHKDPEYLCQLITDKQVTKLHFVPSMLGVIVENANFKQCNSIKQVFCSGEALQQEQVKNFRKILPTARLHNLYGPTEAAIDVSYWDCAGDISQGVPIGRPIDNIQLLVLDNQLNVVPKGAVGELHIGGDGLARGYLNRNELTAERFIANPYYDATAVNSSKRLYKTGDLARLRSDGEIEYRGRTDHQVKIRGFRIELGEVETQLTQIDGVDSALVMAKELAGNQQLVGYIKPRDRLAETDIADYVAAAKALVGQVLPEYMVPNIIMLVEEWPLTPNGKVDRKALPAPDGSVLHGEYVAPETETEQVLVDIWATLLNIQAGSISTTSNFFELGGASLLAISFKSQLNKAGYDINISEILQPIPLKSLAKIVQSHTNDGEIFIAPVNLIASDAENISTEQLNLTSLLDEELKKVVSQVPGGIANIMDIYSLSPLQEGILFHHTILEDDDIYLSSLTLKLDNETLFNKFLDALTTLVGRHDTLRTIFFWQGLSEPVQVVLNNCDLAVEFFELDEYSSTDEAVSKLDNYREQRISLQSGPLLKLKVVKFAEKAEYFVLVQHHHLIMDRFGLDIFLEELRAIINKNPQLLIPSTPFRNIVAYAQAQNIDERGIAFFKEKFVDFNEATILFNSDTVGEEDEFKGLLDPSTSLRLRNLSMKTGYSVASIFHAAWALTVSKCSASLDVAFGTVLLGRLNNYSSTQRTTGNVINTLPLRVTINELSMSEVIEQVVKGLQELIDVEQTPLHSVLNEVSSNSNLFNSILNCRRTHKMSGENSIVEGVQILHAAERTNYPITVNIDDYGLGSDFDIEVQTSNGVSAQELQSYLSNAIIKIVDCLERTPGYVFSCISILSESEENQLLYTMNDTAMDYPKDKCIHELFEQQAADNPDNVAVVFEDKQLTYKELNEKSNQLAYYLREHHGIKQDVLVGLCVDRSLEMVIGIMGILKAGGAYVPLDPSYPQERLSHMLEDAALDVVLSQTQVQTLLADVNSTILMLDGLSDNDNHFCSEYGISNLTETGLASSNLAYVIYTSGSTGKPKGVMVEHQALFNRIHWMHNKYGMSADDKVLQKTPYSFDVSVWEFVWTLAYGAQLVVARPEGHKDPEYLCQLIQEQGITKLHFVPSMLGVILECDRFKNSGSLEQVFCSGEALQQGHVQGFRAVLPKAQLHNLYGPTEAAIDVSYWDCFGDISEGVPIGKPIDNIQLVILDSDLNVVPRGAVGELHIGGDGLARGYLNQNELTAERFIDNPYYDVAHINSSARLYKTGDLARLRTDGDIEYQGRTDHQVKIRGLRIELGEVEHQLGGLTLVDSAQVLAKELAGSMQLVGYVKPSKTVADNVIAEFVADIKKMLGSNLPEYMIPSIIMIVEEWPLTPNGKVDRKALPAPDGSALQGEYVAPETETEQMLVDIWAELLNIEAGTISTTANFFALGGHSLLIPAMITRLNKTGYLLTASDIYHAQTLKSVVNMIKSENAQTSKYSSVSLVPKGTEVLTPDMFDLVALKNTDIEKIVNTVAGGAKNIKDILPLLTLQQGIFFQHLSDPECDLYWRPIIMKVKKDKLDRLISGINTVIERHDTLRSVYIPAFPVPLSVVLKDYTLRVDYHSIDPELSGAKQVEDLTHDMNIDKVPPILLVVARSEENDVCYVKFVAHHLMLDQVGASVVLQEVMAILADEAHLLTQPVPYRSILAYISKNTDNERAQLFFEQKLQGINSVTTIAGITQASFSKQVLFREEYLESAFSEKVRLTSQKYNTSPAVFFHTVFAILMSVVSNRNDVVFGSVFSGRQTTPPGSEQAVGMFMNTLPFRVNMDHASAHNLFASVKESLFGYLSHEHFSLKQATKFTGLEMADSLVNGVLNFRRGTASLEGNDVIELLNDEDKTVPTSPLIVAITDDATDFHIILKVDSRISMIAVWNIFKTIVVNLIDNLADHDSEINIVSDLNSISNRSLLVQNTGTDAKIINESSFVAVELRKIWEQVFQFKDSEVFSSTSLWECEGTLNIEQFVQLINTRFDLNLDKQIILTNYTFGQQVYYITQAFISGAPEEILINDSTQEFGVI
jgi:amino acid adenylation domain-containing protein